MATTKTLKEYRGKRAARDVIDDVNGLLKTRYTPQAYYLWERGQRRIPPAVVRSLDDIFDAGGALLALHNIAAEEPTPLDARLDEILSRLDEMPTKTDLDQAIAGVVATILGVDALAGAPERAPASKPPSTAKSRGRAKP